MDLIGSILPIENGLGGRSSGHRKDKSAQKHIRREVADEKTVLAEERHVVPEYDVYIGRIVDTMA